MRRWIRTWSAAPAALAAALLGHASACDSGEPPGSSGGPPGETVRSSLSFEESPGVGDEALRQLAVGQIALARELLALGGVADNQAISPVSISMAFAMLSAGARGDTLAELADVLHFPAQDVLHPAMNELLVRLRARDVPPSADDDGVALSPVNQIFQEQTFPVESAFLDTLGVSYDAGVQLVDFVGAPDPTRVAINDWVLEQTRDRIADLLPPGSIASLTRLVLVNALYLKAAWEEAFDAHATSDGTFHAPGGDVTVPFLRGDIGGAGYASIDGADVVELPFVGGELAFTVVVPREGATVDLSAVAAQLDTLPRGGAYVNLPRFRVTVPLDLKAALASLGIHDLFDATACDLTGINPDADLYVSGAFHKTFVNVDEKGVEAAAATAIVVGDTSMPPTVTVDEPFYFLVRDLSTGAPLFVGFIADPSASS
ncbi:MAG: serpin family protein [Deltaproteobacteria bacterium]|nr:serpin family protein [Deltaproteobacteria bacterium]